MNSLAPNTPIGFQISKVSRDKRGTARLWFEGRRLLRAAFAVGAKVKKSFDADKHTLTLEIAENGDTTISRKSRSGEDLPVLDIANKSVDEVFGRVERIKATFYPGKIVIEIHPDEAAKARRESRLLGKLKRNLCLSIASLSHGGGVMDAAAHKGLEISGVETRLGFACEIEPEYLETSLRNNRVWADKASKFYCGPMQDIRPADIGKEADILIAGLPCVDASSAGRSKKKLKSAEAGKVGHLFHSFLNVVKWANPSIVQLENVPEYQSTTSMAVIRACLQEWGYTLHEQVLNGNDYGALENRDRFFLVAVSAGLPDLLEGLAPISPKPATLGEVLETVPEDAPSWRTFEYLHKKEQRDKAAGKGFMMQIFTAQSPRIATLRAGYHKGGSTDPLLAHPSNPSLKRLLTHREHAAVKGIDSKLVEGCSNTLAHQILGQSVISKVVEALYATIGLNLKKLIGHETKKPNYLLQKECEKKDSAASVQRQKKSPQTALHSQMDLFAA